MSSLLRLTLVFLFLFVSCNSPKYLERMNEETDYYIVPKPKELIPANGAFLVNQPVTFKFPDELRQEAEFLRKYLYEDFGETPDEKSDGSLVLLQVNEKMGAESYILESTPESLSIEGGSPQAVFYALQSLRQLILKQNGDRLIPAGRIEDQPRFTYRGMHLDVGRHFFNTEEVKQYLDILALHKINTFHWHLTEDQGWRIEIKKYPELTKTGGFRNGTIVGHFPGTSNDNERYGGFYTQEDVKEIVAYAAKRHIRIIPEIEMPGHSQAAIAAYPFLSCFPEEKTTVPEGMMSSTSKEQQENGRIKIVQESWGVYSDVYCAGKEETFEFLENVLDEVMELFPSEYIHIGGDECPKDNWKRCPECQKRMTQLNLENEHELQSYFIQRMEKYINSKGKKIIGWDEILEGGLAPNATVMSWRGEAGGIEAAEQSHEVIMSPTGYCYFDYYQAENTEKEPLAIGGYLPVEKVYSYHPQPEELTQSQQQYILGPQANLWTEYIGNFDKLQYMLLPRLAAISEVGWTNRDDRKWLDFQKRLSALRKVYDRQNYHYATHVFEQPEAH